MKSIQEEAHTLEEASAAVIVGSNRKARCVVLRIMSGAQISVVLTAKDAATIGRMLIEAAQRVPR